MLRAVIPLNDFAEFLVKSGADYVGHSFPELNQGSGPCTVIEIAAEEEEGSWKAGFYRMEKGPLDFEDSLRALHEATRGLI